MVASLKKMCHWLVWYELSHIKLLSYLSNKTDQIEFCKQVEEIGEVLRSIYRYSVNAVQDLKCWLTAFLAIGWP